jgi:hypothetical protein
MRAPVLAAGDGALGFWGALREVFPEAREGRCWFHKIANVLSCDTAGPPLPCPLGLFLEDLSFRRGLASKIGPLVGAASLHLFHQGDQLPVVRLVSLRQFMFLCEHLSGLG